MMKYKIKNLKTQKLIYKNFDLENNISISVQPIKEYFQISRTLSQNLVA